MSRFFSLRNIFEFVWRLAILALPWQTRWIFPVIEGAPVWREQWNNAIYVSWGLILATVILGLIIFRRELILSRRGKMMAGIIFLLFCISIFSTSFFWGTFQWWIQIFVISIFVYVLSISNIGADKLASWFIISLLPHAFLAYDQFFNQRVIGSSWLGIAPQLPATPGVSVVDIGGIRFLRAYGGFPSPNIFGSWLVFGCGASLWLVWKKVGKSAKWWSFAGIILASSLALTFSRSAWLAFIILILLIAWRSRAVLPLKRLKPAFAIIASFIMFTLVAWPLTLARATASGRLEDRSINERILGVKDGLSVFVASPIFGIGQNAFSWSYDQLALPHNIFTLGLAETGIAGAVGFVSLALIVYSVSDREKRLFICAPFILMSFFDHFFWSYWPGQILIGLLTVFVGFDSGEGRRAIDSQRRE